MKERQLINALRHFGVLSGFLAVPLLVGCAGSIGKAQELAGEADAQLKAGNLSDAMQLIDAAIKERDDVAAIYIEKGRIAVAAKSLVEALDAYDQALSLDATNGEALSAVSQLAYILGRFEDAEAAADRVLLLQPGEPNALLVKGVIGLARRKPEKAREFADRILKDNSTDVRGLILKARVLYFEGDTDQAIALLQPAAAGGDTGEPLARTLLELHRARGDAVGMIRDFEKLKELRPRDVPLRIDEAHTRYKSGDRAGAQKIMLFNVLTEASLTPTERTRVVVIWQHFDPDPIPDQLVADKSLEWADTSRLEVARFYIDFRNPQKGLAVIGKGASVDDRALRARATLMMRDDPRAMNDVSAILARDETQCDALLARASVNRRRHQVGKSLIDAQRAVAECQLDTGGYIELARDYQALGDRQAEFRTLDAGLGANPQNGLVAKTYFDRALAMGDTARAVSVARRVTRLAPSLVSGWEMLEDGCQRSRDLVCEKEAAAGLENAKSAFVLDPLPGEPRSGDFFGTLQK